MTIVYLSVAAVFVVALGVAGYSRRRPAPAPAPVFDPLAAWPPDEAAELLAAWRDQRTAS